MCPGKRIKNYILIACKSKNSIKPYFLSPPSRYMDMIVAYIFPTRFEWLLVVTYAVLFVVGLAGNLLVCFAVWRNHR